MTVNSRMYIRLVRRQSLRRDQEEEKEKGEQAETFGGASDDAVVPSEDDEFVKAGYEIPASGDVSGDKDSKREDGEGVHEGGGGGARVELAMATFSDFLGEPDMRGCWQKSATCSLSRCDRGEWWCCMRILVIYSLMLNWLKSRRPRSECPPSLARREHVGVQGLEMQFDFISITINRIIHHGPSFNIRYYL